MITPKSVLTLLLLVVATAGTPVAAAQVEEVCDATDGSCSAAVEDDHEEAAVPDILKPQACEDKEEACARWAQMGECEKNPNYMLCK